MEYRVALDFIFNNHDKFKNSETIIFLNNIYMHSFYNKREIKVKSSITVFLTLQI